MHSTYSTLSWRLSTDGCIRSPLEAYSGSGKVAWKVSKEKQKSSPKFLIRARAQGAVTDIEGGKDMLGWSLTFLVLALLAALFGFGGIAAASAGIAKILFIVFIVLFLGSLLFRGFGRVP